MAASLLEEADPLLLTGWVQDLSPVRAALLEPLARSCLDSHISIDQRQVATSTLAELGADRPELLAEVLLDCDSPRQFSILYRKLALDRQPFAARMNKALDPHDSSATRDRPGWQRRANAALALALLDDWAAFWPCLDETADPSLRTCIIHRMPDYGTQRPRTRRGARSIASSVNPPGYFAGAWRVPA